MTDHPTPTEIAAEAPYPADIERLTFLARLTSNGYMIVHPDDVPHGQTGITDVLPAEAATERIIGWEACRTLIFGDTP